MDKTHLEYYEAGSFWEGDALKDPGNLRRIETTVNLVPEDVKSILDVGCGNGVFGHRLQEVRRNIQIMGVDRSNSALKHVAFDSQIASIDDLPFEEESFDAVSCLQVIEHIRNASYGRSLKELARVSRKFIVIGVPFEENLARETTTCPQCLTVFNIDFHLRSYDLPAVRDMFSELGFSLVDHKFPMQKVRTKYIDELSAVLKGRGREKAQFLSPICPVCDYTEGDKTALNHQPTVPLRSGPRPLYKSVLLKTLRMILPNETVNGYWIVALFQRTSTL